MCAWCSSAKLLNLLIKACSRNTYYYKRYQSSDCVYACVKTVNLLFCFALLFFTLRGQDGLELMNLQP